MKYPSFIVFYQYLTSFRLVDVPEEDEEKDEEKKTG